MATKKKEVLQKKSFADLINFRKKKEISYEGEIIGTLFEPTNEEFTDLFNLIIVYSTENEQNDNPQTLNDMLVPYLLKKMWKSELYTLEELSNDEIMNVFQSLGGEISEQLDTGLYELGIKKIYERINKLNKTSEELQLAEINKEGE